MKTRFIVETPGDRSVGIDPSSATVELDARGIDPTLIRECLQACFRDIWDMSRVTVEETDNVRP